MTDVKDIATKEFNEFLERNTPEVCVPVIFGYVSKVLAMNSRQGKKNLLSYFAKDAGLEIEFKRHLK